MAIFNISCILVLLSASVIVLISPTLAVRNVNSAPTSLEEGKPGSGEFLNQCAKHNTPECANETVNSIFFTGTVSDECCHKLLVMGKACNDAFVSIIAHGPNFQAHLAEYLAKSEEVYKKCVSVVGPPSPSPSPTT